MSGLNNKKYLDETGLATLWSRITNGFSPRWMAYHPAEVGSNVEKTTLVINFVSCATEEQKNNNQGEDIVLTLPAVTDQNAGVMSAADKMKLDNIATATEDAITIKGVKIGIADESGEDNKDARKLIPSNDKFVNWDFVYNSNTDSLDIIDKNASDKVLTSVSVNSFIGDAIKQAILQSADIVGVDDEGNTGTFIKLTFATQDQTETSSTQDIYINVADLIDIYTAGNGITITPTSGEGINDGMRTSTITLDIASTDEQGGFVADWVSTAQEAVAHTDINARTFAVGIGKDDKAMVTVPIGTITKYESKFTNPEVAINPAVGGSANVVTGIIIEENTDKTGHDVILTGNVVKIEKETDITITGDAGVDSKTLTFGGEFTVFKDITPGGINGHALTKSNTTWTLPSLSVGEIVADDDADVQTIMADNSGSQFVFEALTGIGIDNNDNGKIVPIKTKFTAQVDVQSIPDDVITGLAYPTDSLTMS